RGLGADWRHRLARPGRNLDAIIPPPSPYRPLRVARGRQSEDVMHILITGAAGMIGRKLTERLVIDRALGGQPIDKLTLIDIVAPARPAGFSDHVKTRAADLAEAGVADKAVAERPDVI